VHALGRSSEHQSAGNVDAAGLAGDLLDLLVEIDGVLLQLRNVGVAVDGVHATRGVASGAGGEPVALDQHDIVPTCLGEMVEHAGADDAAADDCDPDMGFHDSRAGFDYIESRSRRRVGRGALLRAVPTRSTGAGGHGARDYEKA